jgi:O-antigen biosynthesis protein
MPDNQDKIVERFFPHNTQRRRYYDLGRAGGKILINEGFILFCRSVSYYVRHSSPLKNYHKWIENNEPRPDDLDRLRNTAKNYPYQPRISIITPVWNTDESWLRKAVDSVINQAYDNWELCIADGGSTKGHVRQVLEDYAKKDSRIKTTFLTENKGIAGNSNEALSLATGEFIGFLDHDDELAPFALYEIVDLLNRNPDIGFIYSDEDKIDERGERKDPVFKPDWSPDMFLSYNYPCHVSVVRKSLVDFIGGFQSGYEGSQDYDLFLRLTETIPPHEIVHIPKILYHWRMIAGSAATHFSAKPYALISAKKALNDALIRRNISGEAVDGLYPGSFRIHYTILDNPRVSIIIPTKDHIDLLQRCIRSIREKTTYQNYEIVIVDNQSKKPETFAYYDSFKDDTRIRVLSYNKPFNYAALNNYAATRTKSPYLLFLNNDTDVISGEWLAAMLEHAQRECVGAVGAKLLYPDNTIQHAGVIIGMKGTSPVCWQLHKHVPDPVPGYFGRASHIQDVSAVTAACLMIRKNVFQESGGFTEDFAIAFNDIDLCLKIRKRGYLVVYTPYAKLYHHESASRGYENTSEKKERFSKELKLLQERWGTEIKCGDPYYNPNLTFEDERRIFQINTGK